MPQDFSQIPEADPAVEFRPGRRSEQCADLFAAVAKAQGEIEGAKKDSTNPHFKSSYADLASVRDVTREPLAKNGLAILQWPRTTEGGVEIETILTHSSGQFMSGVLWLPCGKFDAQGIGSAITYGRRYALMAVTGVAPVDDDGNAAVASGGGSRPPAQRSQGWAGSHGDVDEADRGLTDNAPKFTAGQITRMKKWLEGAHGTIKLTGQTVQTLDAFWKENANKTEWLMQNMPTEYAAIEKAYMNARDAAEARAPNTLMAG